MQLEEVLLFLVENSYVKNHKGKFLFTNEFYKKITNVDKGLTVTGKVKEPALAEVNSTESVYLRFIQHCKVPEKGYTSSGTYAMNKFSQDGLKAFEKALKEGYEPELLTLAVTLYYKSSVTMKKAIGNYMTSGEWKTDYALVKKHKEENTLDKLYKQQTNGEYTKFKMA